MAKEVPEIERRQNGDDALVMRARSDCNAFILLYDIYYEKVLRFCFTHLRIRQITEDITSIVFIKAAQNILKFKGKTRRQFVQWLYDIASAEIKHYLKKNVSDRRGETQIEIDDTHKERLRIKLQIAYEQGQAKKSKMPLYLPIAAAMILVGIFIMLSPSHQKPVASPEKPKPLPKFESQKPAKIIERKPAEQPKSASDETIAAAEEEEIEAEEASYEEAEIALVQEPNEAKNAQEQLFEGIVVKGRVLDWQNNPLPATVIKGPFPNEQQTKTLCDANGNFEFHSAQEGIEVITVQCQGAAPAVLPIEIKSGMEPITIMLSPPNIISGQVIDDNGFPIEGAKISAAAWRGVGSLVFSAQTNSQGYFQWDSAPDDEVFFNIQHNNFMTLRQYPMHTGIDYKILLMRPAKIFGQIICSEPGVQVESFIVTVGYFFEKDRISWQDANSVIFSSNKYEIKLTEPLDFKLKIQAEGFQTIESDVFNPPQNALEHDFIIHREY